MFNRQVVSRLERAPYWSGPRLLLDFAGWYVAAIVALRADRAWVTVLVIAFIGAIPMHDILFHSHEGAHGRHGE